MSFIMQALKKADRDRRSAPPPDTSSLVDEIQEEEYEEEEEEAPPPSSGAGKKVVKLVLALAVLGGLGYGAWSQQEYLLSFLEDPKPKQATLAPRPPQKEVASKPPMSLTARKSVPDKPATETTPAATVAPGVSESPPADQPAAKPAPPPPATTVASAPPPVVSLPSPKAVTAAPPPVPPPSAKPATALPSPPVAVAAPVPPPLQQSIPPAVAIPAEAPPPPVEKPAIAISHRTTPAPTARKVEQPVGKVAGVHYGCVIEIRQEDGAMYRLHLGGIGCAESDNTFGKRVRRALAAMVFTKQVRMARVGVEPDGQPSWEVFDPDNTNVNAAMVRAGLAMATDPRYAEMEDIARRERQGMWADLPAPRR